MSTDFRMMKKISASDFFDGRLEKFGVRKLLGPRPEKHTRWLSDEKGSLCILINDNGTVGMMTSYVGGGDPNSILQAIFEAFSVDIVSEHDEAKFWGFDTLEEFEAYRKCTEQELEEKGYQELLRYLRGEPNDIRADTTEMAMAKIARELVGQSPELMLPTNKERPLSSVVDLYRAGPGCLNRFLGR